MSFSGSNWWTCQFDLLKSMLFEHTLSRINADKDNAWALDVCGLGGTVGLKLVILGDCLTCSMTESKLLSRINLFLGIWFASMKTQVPGFRFPSLLRIYNYRVEVSATKHQMSVFKCGVWIGFLKLMEVWVIHSLKIYIGKDWRVLRK